MVTQTEAPRIAIALLQDGDDGRPNRAARRVEAKRIRTSLAAFVTWCKRRYDLIEALAEISDGRDQARTSIPLSAILLGVLALFWMRLGSIRELDDRLRTNPGLSRLLAQAGWDGTVSDDTFRDALAVLDMVALRVHLQRFAKREIKRWAAGRHKDSILGQRLRNLGGPVVGGLVARLPVALDGHELFCSEHRHCPMCLTREVRKKRNGQEVLVTEYYHKVVVAQVEGAHPGLFLDFEPLQPGEGELFPAYRLVRRLSRVYGQAIGTLIADAAYDGGPFRREAQRAGYRFVIRHKNKLIDPGRSLRQRLDRRDPERRAPDWRYREAGTGRVYACWVEAEHPDGWRYIYARRTDKNGQVHTGACLTDLPAREAPAVAVAMLMESRWFIESGFHEIAGSWRLDRPFVHAGRPTAAEAIVTLGLMAYNALMAYVYRELGLDPARPQRTIDDIKADLRETLILFPRGLQQTRGP